MVQISHRMRALPLGWGARSRDFKVGAIIIVVFLGTLVLLAFKNPIAVGLRDGQVIHAEFTEDYGLTASRTKVKAGGVEVGIVTDIERVDSITRVTMKIDDDAFDVLGSNPTASIEPLIILGGAYAIHLSPGGDGEFDEDGTIPLANTSTPTELDRILEALPKSTREHTQSLLGRARNDLRRTRTEIQRLLREAPDTLPAGADVFEALMGTQPRTDLRDVVRYLYRTGRALGAEQQNLDLALSDLETVTDALGDESESVATLVRNLPQTLRSTRHGLQSLDTTLVRLEPAARGMRPAIRELGRVLDELDPLLGEIRPLLRGLRPTLRDARPLFHDLTPVTTSATGALKDVRGPVLDRVRGPILDTLDNTWQGSGPYRRSGGGYQADHKMYEEIGYMLSNIARASQAHDSHGALLGFQVSGGPSSVAPFTFDEYMSQMLGLPFDGTNR